MAQDRTILHQDDVEAVIDERIAVAPGFAKRGESSVASPAAEVAPLKIAVDELIAALVAAKVLKVAE